MVIQGKRCARVLIGFWDRAWKEQGSQVRTQERVLMVAFNNTKLSTVYQALSQKKKSRRIQEKKEIKRKVRERERKRNEIIEKDAIRKQRVKPDTDRTIQRTFLEIKENERPEYASAKDSSKKDKH